jgi:hypothetical protein
MPVLLLRSCRAAILKDIPVEPRGFPENDSQVYPHSEKACRLNRSMQHHLRYKSFTLKGGVHDAREREAMEAFGGAAGRYVEPLEGWTVVT